ncbi:MAG TPA: DUF2326 domain-containing protein [Polyangiaceae bacterium]|nr:DUF2326 domain-containing protein [Polyangiaceae bacterium]
MIRRVYCDDPRFKDLTFHSGLNILVAEKSRGANDKQTRNGAGKSSMLEILHFLLGSSCDKDSLFRNPKLRSATFGLELDLGGALARVERSGEKPSPVKVEGDSTLWAVAPSVKDGVSSLTNDNWKTVLGKAMFGLDDLDEAWSPKFRSLISYFVRRDRDGGMALPMAQSQKQQIVDQQVAVSYLLGLDWSIPQQWQKIRDRENAVKQIKKGLNSGNFAALVGGSAASLKSAHIVAQDDVKRLKMSLASFKVLEQYHELEREASVLTGKLSALVDDNVLDRRYLQELEQTTVDEVAPAPDDLYRLYEEAGVVLPELIKKRFDDVNLFHESVVRNRRSYLTAEVAGTKARIAEREQEKTKLDARRAEVMTILKSAGALEHFTALQSELAKTEARAEALKQRFDTMEAMETGALRLTVERAHLVERLHQSYHDEEETISKAVLTFRDISSRLYEEGKAGYLHITPGDNGPAFEAHIPAEKSKGVNNMRIFCFDMMLMALSLARGRSPGFLVHDSHLFDGVDPRQRAKALTVGAELAERHGFQYVVTMNTNDVPPGFKEHILDVHLSDASEDGGLFGFRFD